LNNLILEPVKLVEGTEDVRGLLLSLHTLGERAFWAKAMALARLDQQSIWTLNHENFFNWYADYIEGNGFTRPETSQAMSFYLQVRCGYFLERCGNLGVPLDSLISVGRSKCDIIHSKIKQKMDEGEIDKEEMMELLDRAAEMPRDHVHKLLGVDKKRKNLNPADEPPAPSPIDETRIPSTITVTCPKCGETYEKEQ